MSFEPVLRLRSLTSPVDRVREGCESVCGGASRDDGVGPWTMTVYHVYLLATAGILRAGPGAIRIQI